MLPDFDPEELLACLKRLIRIEEEWIPHSETSSLYIRPTYIGTDVSGGADYANLFLVSFCSLCNLGVFF